jgi:hypothetical protein
MKFIWGHSFFKPLDSKGRESRTLFFVGLTWFLMAGRFLLGGLEVSYYFVKFSVQSTSLTDFGVAVAALLAVWVGREWSNRQSKQEQVS